MTISDKKSYELNFKEIDKLADKWPSNLVSRQELERFSGGVLCGRTEANKESRGDDDALKPLKLGKKRFYTVQNVIETLKLRMSKC